MKTSKKVGLAMAVALVATLKLCAGESSAALNTLSGVSPAELPAKAAALVSQADAKTRLETTADVVKAAVGLNPAAAPAIVGTIAQSTPEVAAVAVATAVRLVPGQAIAIARAAAAAAQSQAGKIVEAVCRIVPGSYREVANAVAAVAPDAAKEILAGVSAAIPALQEPINKILAGSTGGTPSVSDVLGQVPQTALLVGGKSGMAISPAVQTGPPFVTPPPSPVNLSPGSGGEVPEGGRNYASPPPP